MLDEKMYQPRVIELNKKIKSFQPKIDLSKPYLNNESELSNSF